MVVSRVPALVLLGFLLALPCRGSAYCRTTTEETVASGCPEICQRAGLPLYWPRRQLSYALNSRGFPNLSEAKLRDVLERSFDTWLQVDCEQRPIDLYIEQLSQTSNLEAGPKEREPNTNVIAYIDATSWREDAHAFAITKIWYSAKTAHILGADMLLNGNMAPFGECPFPLGCERDEMTDLRNVVTHEAGHFLGLAHSDDRESTMWCDADPGDINKRSLGHDDVNGICAIFGPNASSGPPPTPSTIYSSNFLCSARGGDGSAKRDFWAAPLLGVLALFGYRRRNA